LRDGNVAEEERWNDRGNQRESDRRSRLADRVASTSAHVDQFRDDPAWREAIRHRSIPQYWPMRLRNYLRRQILNLRFSAASNSCRLAAYVEKLFCSNWSQVLLQTCPLVGRWLACAICSIKYEFMFKAPIYRARQSVFPT
jgi:hypothetical protein